MKFRRFFPFLIILFLIATLLLESCYTVRLRSVAGTPEAEVPLVRDDYYRGMQVIELDTVIGIGVADKDFTYLIKKNDRCPSGKLHTVEYRNTLGGILLSAITFGRKRKVKVKYVCMEVN